MIESWKTRHTFMDDVNIITKLFIGIALFFMVIFIHNFDVMLYLVALMFIFMLFMSGAKLHILMGFVAFTLLFALSSSLFYDFLRVRPSRIVQIWICAYYSGKSRSWSTPFFKNACSQLFRTVHCLFFPSYYRIL